MAPPPPPDGADPSQSSNPSWYDIPGQIEKAINTWLGDMVKSALEPVLHFVGSTLLSSPDVSDGRIAQVWTASLVTANTLYVLFILVGGLIVIGHETVQTRYSAKEIAPRLVLGMIASNASLWAISQTVSLGNVLAQSLMNGRISSEGVGRVLVLMVVDKIFMPGSTGAILLILLGAVIAAMGLALIVTYLIRAAVLLILTAGAPLAFACHALPQTEGLAKLWWRAIFGCMATQLAQSLTLIMCVQVFFDPHATVILGLPATAGTLTDLLLCLCLFFVLIKIPVWVHRIVMRRSPFGMTMAGRLGMSFLYYRLFMKLRGPRSIGARQSPPPRRYGGVWPNTTRPGPPTPGTGLSKLNPRPGGGSGPAGMGGWTPSPPTATATQVWPAPARPHGSPPPTALGPVRKTPLALPIGATERRNRSHQQTVASPPPRGKQFGLFPPVEATPGPAGGRRKQDAGPPVSSPSRPMKGDQPLFPNPQPRKRGPQAAPSGPGRLSLAPLFLSVADYEQEQQAPPKRRGPRAPSAAAHARSVVSGAPRPPTPSPPSETGA